MIAQPKRAVSWLRVLFVPLVAAAGSDLGCELLVNVDSMLVDGSPDDVVIPMTLDGYDCPICTDVSPDADFDGDEVFPETEPKDSTSETSPHDATSESSTTDAGPRDGDLAGADSG
jgi:hypothetical protein